jgi:hypothetical protein
MTWYDPDELADQADGDQTAVEFDPAATPDYAEIENIGDPAVADILTDYSDALATTIAGFTQNYPTVSAPGFDSGFSAGFNSRI